MVDEELVRYLISEGNKSFDEECQARHDKGQEQYGTFTFLENDVVAMAKEELADFANYVRYMYIKLYILEYQIGTSIGDEEIPIGPTAFIPSKPVQKGE